MSDEYDKMTVRDWVNYEFGTIAYDFQLHAEAIRRIYTLFDRLEKND